MSAVRTRKKYLKFRDGEIIHERRGEMGRSSASRPGRQLVSYFPASKTGNVSDCRVVRFVSEEQSVASSP